MKIAKKFLKPYNYQKTEKKIYRLWQKSSYFSPDKLRTRKKPFSIVLPPPNITGSLHMGHALNAAIQDVLIRKRRMEGYQTVWVPGTDHAGIATQNVVEKKLKKEGLTRFDLGREKFIKEVWQWKKKYGNIILEQLKKIGASCDWSRKKFTMDKDYALAVLKSFEIYWRNNLIYLGERTVNWCPRCETSLSDLELEYKEEEGGLYFIKYPLAGSKFKTRDFLVVATTRPETMFGDTAVAVNPTDKRYQKLIGKKVVLPLVGREIPIIADEIVDKEFGTGVLKITPAHDHNDFEVSQRHCLERIKVIDEKGRICSPAPEKYQGLKTKEAREKVVEDLRKLGFLEKIEPYFHSLPICSRCHTEIEPLISKQWFVRMKDLADLAIRAVEQGKIKFYPKKWEKIYFDWLKNVKDWCISRQIWWGHRLPLWRCQSKEEMEEEKRYFLSLKKPKKCPICQKCQPKQVDDVLDTWFSSALWPFAVFGWPKKTKDLKKFYPTNVLSTARDIINLWVARMIFSGIYFLKKIPFSQVIIHPTILTKEGKRMSKSLGTGIDPLDLIEKYGADATRFGLLWQMKGSQDIHFSEEHLLMAKKFSNKIWNASRFVLTQVASLNLIFSSSKIKIKEENLSRADNLILRKLKRTLKEVNDDLEKFRFASAEENLYNFFWHDFCDIYLEKAKKEISQAKSRKEKEKIVKVLFYILLTSLKILHPFLPFLTEEIYQELPVKRKEKFLMIEKWPI